MLALQCLVWGSEWARYTASVMTRVALMRGQSPSPPYLPSGFRHLQSRHFRLFPRHNTGSLDNYINYTRQSRLQSWEKVRGRCWFGGNSRWVYVIVSTPIVMLLRRVGEEWLQWVWKLDVQFTVWLLYIYLQFSSVACYVCKIKSHVIDNGVDCIPHIIIEIDNVDW